MNYAIQNQIDSVYDHVNESLNLMDTNVNSKISNEFKHLESNFCDLFNNFGDDLTRKTFDVSNEMESLESRNYQSFKLNDFN